MLKLRINPLVATDLKEIRDYIAEDNAEYAAKTNKEIYGKFGDKKCLTPLNFPLNFYKLIENT